jgi:hypothetical protein
VTLQRPPRKGNLLAPSLETSVELQILSEIQAIRSEQQGLREGQEGARGQIRDMRTILMGSGEPSGETQYGRIPMVEASVKALDDRVDVLESNQVKASAYFNSARIFGHIITGCVGAALLALVEHLVK